MFAAISARARQAADGRARARIREFAERLKAVLPEGISVDAGDDGVRLSGKGLRRRVALDTTLNWLIRGMLR